MALLNAGLAAGTSLIGGMFQNKANSKAARDQFHYQDALDRNAFMYQRSLQDHQNAEINRTNDRIERWNKEILDNHSTSTTKVTDESWSRTEDTTGSTSIGSIDFNRLVADAEAAGFNPLTVLRAGGLAGYSTTNVQNRGGITVTNGGTVTTEHKAARDLMTFFGHGEIPQGPQAGQAPVVQRTSAVNSALQAGLQAWQAYDRNAQARFELEKGLAQAQIRNFDSDTARNNRFGFSIPSYTAPTVRTSGGGIAGSVRAQQPGGQLGAVAQPTVGEVKVTNPWPWGGVVSWLRDAAASEERYAELLSNVHGAFNAAADGVSIVHQAGKAANAASGGVGTRIRDSVSTNVATSKTGTALTRAYEAMVRAWNDPAWNAKQ